MIDTLKARARRGFSAALAAADPAAALIAALDTAPLARPDPGGKRYIIGIGKAARAMVKTALLANGNTDHTALVVTNYENASSLQGVPVLAAGHPIPDDNGLHAARAVGEYLDAASAKDRVIILLSGGGSALLPAPIDGVTLDDKIKVNKLLLGHGFDIYETNLIRQHLSRFKGGGMLQIAHPAPVSGYILSDVVGDDLNVIASGPTAARIGTIDDARGLIQGRGLFEELPASVRAAFRRPQETHRPIAAQNYLIGSNKICAAAMADAVGARFQNEPLVGNVKEAAARILREAAACDLTQPFSLAWGGETTVEVTGSGLGGRNQELALRIARDGPRVLAHGEWCFLSGGTDGRDGPTDAAGGLVDQNSWSRILAKGKDPEALLANNDAYHALKLSEDLLITGPTGTNLADVQLLFYTPKPGP